MLPVDGPDLTDQSLSDLAVRFHAAHLARFSFDDRKETVELVTLRLSAVGRLGDVDGATTATGRTAPHQAFRMVHHGGGPREFRIVQQDDIAAGASVDGPAVIEQDYTSLLLGAGWRLIMAATGDMLAKRSAP
jgi:N-methylhydantoinase A